MQRIYDLSPLLHPAAPVWPGDIPFSLDRSLSATAGDAVTLASVTMSLHVGSHMDAPSHVCRDGATIDLIPLEAGLGPARVVSIGARDLIQPEDLLSCLGPAFPPRLLLRLRPESPAPVFSPEFPALSAGSARLLAERAVRLVGVDTPSVDTFADDSLPAHCILAEAGIAILENLQLQNVPDGDYELIALPLRIQGGEASPVRAILRTSPATLP